ncbi:MAG: bis-aminopropyl spermidine synthase family protein [Myxococcales bacterium]|nr:bis-aminopropyl spermidine synthase family protein [Myxococcales bacterium]
MIDTALPPDNSPSSHIRTFLHQLFTEIGDPLPEMWPHVSSAEYASRFRTLRQRLSQLYDFLDKHPTQNRVQRLFTRFYAESASALFALDREQAGLSLQAHPSSVQKLAARPPVEVRYDQLYCTPDSTERRVNKILEVQSSPDQGRVLFVGDDDLGSIVLSDRFQGEIHVIDLDTRLLDFIEQQAPQVQLHKIDLILGGVPPWMQGHFDTVVLDPPWDIGGAWAFLSRALYCLKQSPAARIILAFCPIQMELIGSEMRRFWLRLARYGLACESIHAACHLYDLTPMQTESYRRAFGLYLPEIESPLFDVLIKVPYTFSHLYELRRIEGFRMGKLRQKLFSWWLTNNQGPHEPPALSAANEPQEEIDAAEETIPSTYPAPPLQDATPHTIPEQSPSTAEAVPKEPAS